MEHIPAKTIVTKTKSNDWFGCDYNMNIYKGCNHGCIYCDSRSECYRVEDFDRVRTKENALEIIRNDLRRKVKKGVIGTGSMSDPYNSFEKEMKLTRHSLELIDAFEFGISIATKSTLVARDIDILQSIKEHSPVIVKLTITTADDAKALLIEPGASLSSERFALLKELRKAGIFAGIMLLPVLPFINDDEESIFQILEKAIENEARFIYPGFGVTLRMNQRIYYYEQLQKLFPDDNYAERYRQAYGNRYHCSIPNAKELYQSFTNACAKNNILYDMRDITHSDKGNYSDGQLRLFD